MCFIFETEHFSPTGNILHFVGYATIEHVLSDCTCVSLYMCFHPDHDDYSWICRGPVLSVLSEEGAVIFPHNGVMEQHHSISFPWGEMRMCAECPAGMHSDMKPSQRKSPTTFILLPRHTFTEILCYSILTDGLWKVLNDLCCNSVIRTQKLSWQKTI